MNHLDPLEEGNSITGSVGSITRSKQISELSSTVLPNIRALLLCIREAQCLYSWPSGWLSWWGAAGSIQFRQARAGLLQTRPGTIPSRPHPIHSQQYIPILHYLAYAAEKSPLNNNTPDRFSSDYTCDYPVFIFSCKISLSRWMNPYEDQFTARRN